MTISDAEHWRLLSPLLDGLLDLEPGERAGRLEELRAHDPELAAELAALIADAEHAAATDFLADGARHRLPPADTESTLAGHRVGAYVLEDALGQGGTGVVWRAHRGDGRYSGHVAVKLLHLSLVGQTGARRFEREGAILARLSHPHIARLLDAGISTGTQPYIVLELVEGERIDRHCDARHLSVAERVALFRDVLAAVAHAHRHLVIHRDIKPSNVLVGTEGVKLLDFGIAKLLQGEPGEIAPLTREGTNALTPDYAAPEQLRGEDVTTATDVYALGVLLYQLLAGRHPTAPSPSSADALMRATLDVDPHRLSTVATVGDTTPADFVARIAVERDTSPPRLRRVLAGDLENIVAKALRKVPGERYATVDAFNEDLRRWQVGEPVTARPDSIGYRTARFVGRHRGAVAAALLTFVVIVAGLVGTITQARRAEAQSAIAAREANTARLERDAATEQARLERGTAEFFALVLRDANGRDPGAMRQQLDRSVVLLEQSPFEHPIIKVSLLRQLASRYAELGDQKTAVSLNRKAIAAVTGTELAAPTSGVPVNLACSLAARLIDLGDAKGALAELDRADRLLAAGAQVSVPSRASCIEQRGHADLALGSYSEGARLFRDALKQLDAAGVRDGEQVRVLRSDVSMALRDAGDNAGAMAIARPLLQESMASQGRRSVGVLNRSAIVTGLTRRGGDPLAALALSDADRATSEQVNGAGSVKSAFELERSRILLQLGRAHEAADAFARSAKAARGEGSEPEELLAGLGEIEALAADGRTDAAAARFAEIAPLRAAAVGPQRVDVLRTTALLATARGDSAAARDALQAAARLAESPPGEPHPQSFGVALLQGQSALAEGRADADALAAADRALAAARRSALDPARSSDVGRALLLRARLLKAAGRGEEARRDAASAAAELAPTLGDAHPDTLAAAALAAAG